MKNKQKRNIRAKDIIILTLTVAVVLAIIIFCACKWRLVLDLLNLVVRGKDIVRETVLGWGVVGEIAIGIMLVFCFFFPFFSSLPLQILCMMVYGVWHATLLIAISLSVAAQLLFWFEKSFKTFCYSKKQLEKQKAIEERIKNSSRNIHLVMVLLYIVPCIPFLVISSVACRSNMKWWVYTFYTVVGPIPEIIVTLLLGDQVTSNSSPVVSVIILIFMIILVVLSLVYKDKMIYFVFKPKKAVDGQGDTTASDIENVPEETAETEAEEIDVNEETTAKTDATENSVQDDDDERR